MRCAAHGTPARVSTPALLAPSGSEPVRTESDASVGNGSWCHPRLPSHGPETECRLEPGPPGVAPLHPRLCPHFSRFARAGAPVPLQTATCRPPGSCELLEGSGRPCSLGAIIHGTQEVPRTCSQTWNE